MTSWRSETPPKPPSQDGPGYVLIGRTHIHTFFSVKCYFNRATLYTNMIYPNSITCNNIHLYLEY